MRTTPGALSRLSRVCLALAVGLAGRDLHAQEPLRWRLPPGLRLEGTLRRQETCWRRNRIHHEVDATVTYSLTVGEPAPDGGAVLSCRVDRFLYRDERPGMSRLEYDISETITAEVAKALPFPLSALLAGRDLTLVLSPQGEVSRVALPEAVTLAAARIPALAALAPAELEAIAGNALAGFPRFSVKALREGESWEEDERIDDEGLLRGSLRKMAYTYLGRATGEEGDIHTIASEQPAPPVAAAGQTASLPRPLLMFSGEARFDAAAGRFSQSLHKLEYAEGAGQEELTHEVIVKKQLVEVIAKKQLVEPGEDGTAAPAPVIVEVSSLRLESMLLGSQGSALLERGNPAAAILHFEKAAASLRSLLPSERDRSADDYLMWLLESQLSCRGQLVKLGTYDELVALLLQSITTEQSQAREEQLAWVLAHRAWRLRQPDGDDVQAERDLTEAIKIYGRLADTAGSDSLREALASQLSSRADLRSRQERHGDAALDLEQATEIYRGLVVSKRRFDLEPSLARDLRSRGNQLARCAELDAAEACLNEAIDLSSRLEEEGVRNERDENLAPTRASEIESETLVDRAYLFILQKKGAEARRDLDQAVEILAYLAGGSAGGADERLRYSLDLRQYLDRYYPLVSGDDAADRAKPASYWIAQLASDDDYVRLRAVGALGGRATEPSILGLAQALKDASLSVRRSAARALDAIGPPARSAAPALIETLNDKGLRESATNALGRIGRGAVPALIVALTRDEGEIRRAAAWALWSMGWQAEPAVPALIEALRDQEAGVRRAAARALGRAGAGDAAVAALLAGALGDGQDEVRESCLLALGEMGASARAALPEIQKLRNAAQSEIRTAATTASDQIDAAAAHTSRDEQATDP